jgi:hypothetical protein
MHVPLLLFLAVAVPSPAFAGEGGDSRAAELASLRREVETLSTELALKKDDVRARLKAIEAQKAEVQVQLRREELRLAQVEGEAASRRAAVAENATRGATLGPAVLAAAETLRRYVETGLPYHRADRLSELERLLAQLAAGDLSAEAATARLWAFGEDELRLARESGLDRQVVSIGGSEVLADVARLGMAGMYCRTDAGLAGVARRASGTWTWVALTERDDIRAVESLFEKFKHGVRSGDFLLPAPSVEGA